MKKTAVLGASTNPQRYSFLATQMLQENGLEVLPLGIKEGLCAGLPIVTKWPEKVDDLDTLTLYLGPKNQPEHYAFILGLKPRRIIFNPGTENSELAALATIQGIEVEEACTLVLLRTGQY
jgi:predicted CoA-binding protein